MLSMRAKPGDIRAEFRYLVVSTNIVRPENIAVLDPGGTEILTLAPAIRFASLVLPPTGL